MENSNRVQEAGRRLVAGTFLLFASAAPAANVVASNDSDPHPIVLTSGALVPDGAGFVAAGSFTLSDVQIGAATSSGASFAALSADFLTFGSAVPFGVGSEGGLFSDTFVQGITAGDPLIGQPIFLVAGNGSELANSDEVWVFKSGENFAADGVDPFSARIELDAELQAGVVIIGTPINILLPGAGRSFDGSQMVRVVPEPGTAALLGLGVTGVLLLRRRR